MPEKELVIYGDDASGNCLKVRWIADYLKIPYRWIGVDVVSRQTRTPEFLKLNPAGQVPLVVLEDGRALAQSDAILLHLAERVKSDLIPSDPYLRAKVYEWLFWEQYSHETAIAVRRFQKTYLGKSDAEIDPKLLERGHAALARMELQLLEGGFIAGPSFTLADIALVAYTRVAHEGGFDLEDYPRTRAWVARVEKTLGLPPAQGAS
jgi:glutathione S-transferase